MPADSCFLWDLTVRDALHVPLSNDDRRVALTFGINATRLNEVFEIARNRLTAIVKGPNAALRTLGPQHTVDAAGAIEVEADEERGRQIIQDGDLQTLLGDIDGDVLTTLARLIPKHMGDDHFILDATLPSFIPGGHSENANMSSTLAETYFSKHVTLQGRLYAPTNTTLAPRELGKRAAPAHWTLNILDHSANTAQCLEPLADPHNERAAINATCLTQLESFLTSERVLRNKAPRITPFIRVQRPPLLSHQDDATSCGAFVFAYIYYDLIHGRPPSSADFSGRHQLVLRLVMLDAALMGRIWVGTLPGAPPGAPL